MVLKSVVKRIDEESSELIAALSSEADTNVINEAADLIFHVMVGLRSRGLALEDVARVLRSREGISGIEEKASREVQGSP